MAELDFGGGIDAALVADDRPIAGTVDGEAVVLVRHGGRICALAGKCTHLQAPLADGIVVDGEIRCPWHHARFSLQTGEAVGAPAFKPLDRFEVVEEDGKVRVAGKAAKGSAAHQSRDLGRIVIVGAGGAGHACADMLARGGAGGSVVLLSSDPDAPYDRTYCSKQFLAGKAERDDTRLPMPGEAQGGGVTLRTATTIAAIDRDAKAVVTDDGERIAYDTLVLATGAEPVVPDFAGADRDDVHVLRTLADAEALRAAAGDAQRAIVLGSSFIGLEAAASLVAQGLSVTVVAKGSVPLAKTAGPEVGTMVRALHEEKGVAFRMESEIRSWDGATATLDSGDIVSGDLLVAGTGVSPRIDLAKEAGLALASEDDGGGIVVDAALRTSDPRIYAIGDIANHPDPRLGHSIRVEHWVVAQRMGQWLARHLLGEGDEAYGEVPFFWSGHYDTSLRYVGHVASPEDRRVEGDVEAKDVAVFFREDGEEQALLACGRDRQALEVEARWDR